MIQSQFDLFMLPPRYLVLFAVFLLTIAMGLFIVFQAYWGYRRNANRRMLFLAVGLAFVTVIPPLVSLLIASIAQVFEVELVIFVYYLPLSTSLIQAFGLSFIIYSLSIRGKG
ncbi:DUF7521 family protein [Halopelagius longus]|uniref:Uncharacterized protein n=1 Tax=Halopelagius longus TaxID=1236180 RepID=A0A1H1AG48_9EURY|nr:hypothetical protein [Halopelagius longus]RDI70362.1 hypothetical protein DWB78_00740 [Halopelagius longus]SDQ38511.1 hypothetical protein SAMN05216278_1316 [Halopelagius longus]